MDRTPLNDTEGPGIFESVPNLSCARDAGLLDELGARMRDAGVLVVDRSADVDHRRSVWTWLGTPTAIERAASRCLELLNERRRLAQHRGVHPRTGLVDVLPWIPLREVVGSDSPLSAATTIQASTQDAARDAARRTGGRLAERHEIPVFFYEDAAPSAAAGTAGDRRNLALHRRRLLQGNHLEIPPGWLPDAGPNRPHDHLGALMVGARRPLIAFNLDLATDDVRVARAIAGAIRQTAEGGLPGVKALGLFLPERRCAQVSVNLVDARRTTLPELVARVRDEAHRRGHQIRRGERIGLLTATAVAGASADDLALDTLDPDHLIETHVARLLGQARRRR